MPIKIPDSLPAFKTLNDENIFVIPEQRAAHQDIRPLKILILNLMPKKIETETQLLRVLSNSALQVDIELIQPKTHISKNTHSEHLNKFYRYWSEVKNERFDGMIITGAPIELMPFEEVDYWQELCQIFDWAQKNVYSTFNICWGAQSAIYHKYKIDKEPLDKKLFGVFLHKTEQPQHPILRGFDECFYAPHSRHTTISTQKLQSCKELEILASSQQAGAYIIASKDNRHFFVTGHSEYDRYTLANEYKRDVLSGNEIQVPYNYYKDDDVNSVPMFTFRAHGHLLYANWLNYFVYQATPYDLASL